MKMSTIAGGLNHLFRRIIFSIHGYGKWFLKNCISFLWSEEIIVIGFIFVSFLHNCMDFLFLAVICFPLSIQLNILTLYNNCYVTLITYAWFSPRAFLYNLSKNLLLLPWILILIVDMVNDSTPLNSE